ncbi:hypothetical protein PR048_019724 [Dryococelus australis]|uniref:Transposase Tc1-like domain-containing protein n=1 Tax=Dryococelus australis TaxID=614101 RepID=A0ABQ9H4A1_9NEOP|nr:hypothetical protein PR048_019724 [Dryococelus australis]
MVPAGLSGFSHVGIVPDDAVGRRVFRGSHVSPALSFRRCSILTLITLAVSLYLDSWPTCAYLILNNQPTCGINRHSRSGIHPQMHVAHMMNDDCGMMCLRVGHIRIFNCQQMSGKTRVLRHAATTAMHVCNPWIEEGSTQRRVGTGPRSVTTVRDDRNLVRMAVTERRASSTVLARHWSTVTGVDLSASTVRRRLLRAGLVPLRRLSLSRDHKRFRLQRARERRRWRVEWQHVVFSDEYRFNLSYSDGCIRVRRYRGDRILAACIVERHSGQMPSVMVWGAMRSQPLSIEGNLNKPEVLPLLQVTPHDIFQQDNARPHVTRNVQAFFNELRVSMLPWLARSPDLHVHPSNISGIWLVELVILNVGRRWRSRLGARPPPLTNTGDPGSIPGGFTLGFSRVGIVPLSRGGGGLSRHIPASPALAFKHRYILGSHFMSCPGMVGTYRSQLASPSFGGSRFALGALITLAWVTQLPQKLSFSGYSGGETSALLVPKTRSYRKYAEFPYLVFTDISSKSEVFTTEIAAQLNSPAV